MRRGIPYDSRRGAAICGAMTAIMCGEAYATSAEMARELGPFPGYEKNHDPMLRVMRNHRRAAYNVAGGGVRGPHASRPLGIDPAHCPARAAHGRARGLGPRGRARRAARLPQRAGHRARADRHHRPRHGLRHHRHRARLRAGEVQEARRRRLLQDHQPEPDPGAARRSATRRPRSTTSWPTAWAAGRSRGAPVINHDTLARQGLRRGGARSSSKRSLEPRSTSPSPSTRWTLGEDYVRLAARPQRGAARRVERQPAPRARLHAGRDRGGQRLLLRHHDRRGRAAPEGRAPARLRLRQQLRQEGQALHRHRGAHPHDGGGPAVHLGRDQQDDQHAHTTPPSRTSSGPTTSRWRGMLKAIALYRDGSKLSPAAQLHDATSEEEQAAAADVEAVAEKMTERVVTQYLARAASPARPPLRLHAEGGGRRPQGLPPHRRVRGRHARRDLPRHAQGRGRLPLA